MKMKFAPYISRRTALRGLGATAAVSIANPLNARANPDWTTQLRPFRIAGNIYYVGSRDLASYLVATDRGHILINSNLTTSPPQIRASIEKLGFHYGDVKIVLISHAHFDHCGGCAQMRRETGAKCMVMEGDADVVESGGKADFHFGSDLSMRYPQVRVDRVLRDGDRVELGSVVLTAHKTAGHTKGCTTWTLPVTENGKLLNAVIVGGPYALESYNLIDDPKYPQMSADFANQFRTLGSLPCDIFLGAHGGYFDLLAKVAKLKAGETEAFISPQGYRAAIAEWQQGFEAALAIQKKRHPIRAA